MKQQNIDEYKEDNSYEPEISLCIAWASKIFWMKPIKDDNLKLKLGEVKIPSNCIFLRTKKSNPDIFSVIHHLYHAHDCKIWSIKKTYVAVTTLMLKADSELTKLLPKHNNANLDIKTTYHYWKVPNH